MDDADHPGTGHGTAAKRFGRRATLRLLGAGLTGAATGMALGRTGEAMPAVRPVPASQPSRPVGRAWALRPLAAGTAPKALTREGLATLEAVVERIIPATETPGASAVGVHWYLDDVAAHDPKVRAHLISGLERLERLAAARHEQRFTALDPVRQDRLLAAIDTGAGGTVKVDEAGRPLVTGDATVTEAITPDDRSFFAFLKAQTIDAYYKSEMGQIGELEWIGHEFNDEFPGRCTHADPLDHPRPRWPRTAPARSAR